jgi:5-methylcytosine-specific restriction endonuclease McrA
MKIDRNKVYQKYDGHCAYCGKKITFKEMQVDHKIPKRNAVSLATKNLLGEWVLPDLNVFENLMPSCRRCNHYKRAESLNRYRGMIDTIPEILKENYIFKVALDYGLIEIKEWDGVFYFERQKGDNK